MCVCLEASLNEAITDRQQFSPPHPVADPARCPCLPFSFSRRIGAVGAVGAGAEFAESVGVAAAVVGAAVDVVGVGAGGADVESVSVWVGGSEQEATGCANQSIPR